MVTALGGVCVPAGLLDAAVPGLPTVVVALAAFVVAVEVMAGMLTGEGERIGILKKNQMRIASVTITMLTTIDRERFKFAINQL
jgi:hypothetical protein